MVAEFESDLIRLRTREGMKVSKAKGRLHGKQPKLNRRQEAHLVSLVQRGEYSTLEVAELLGLAAVPSTAPLSVNASKTETALRRHHRDVDTSSRRRRPESDAPARRRRLKASDRARGFACGRRTCRLSGRSTSGGRRA